MCACSTAARQVTRSCRALVDTGVSITIFDRPTADALMTPNWELGVPQRSTNNARQRVAASVRVRRHGVSVTPGVPPGPRTSPFVTDYGLQMRFQGVLGTDGFLDKYAVTFK